MLWVRAWGAVASATIAVASTQAGPVTGVVLPDGPLGLWQATSERRMAWSVVAVVGIALLGLAFLRVYRLARAGAADVRSVLVTAACWIAPLLACQPLLSLDVYSYLAQGQIVALGINPYASGPVVLGPGPVLDAVAPLWRTTPAPYGPLSLSLLGWLTHVSDAGHIMFVLLLRTLAVLSVAACAVAAIRLVRPGSPAVPVALVVANPVVILHLVGGVHLDVLITVLAAAVLLAVQRGWWWLAALAAAVAFSVKLPGLVLVGYVLLARLGTPGSRRVASLLGALALTAGTVVACAALLPDGWGWLAAMDTPGRNHQLYAVPSILAELGHRAGAAAGADLHLDQVLTWMRLGCAAAGMAAVFVLLVRASQAADTRRAGALVGIAFMIVAFAAPVIHAWYLSWGLVLLAACAGAATRRWVIVVSVAACFTAVPDPLTRTDGGIAVVVAVLVAAVGVTVWWLIGRDRHGEPGRPLANAG